MSLVNEDAKEAWTEINSLGSSSLNSWEFVFNADEHRLPDSENDINVFRLSEDQLLDFGKRVTRLRESPRYPLAANVVEYDTKD